MTQSKTHQWPFGGTNALVNALTSSGIISKDVSCFQVLFYDANGTAIADELSSMVEGVGQIPRVIKAALLNETADWKMYDVAAHTSLLGMEKLIVAFGDDLDNEAMMQVYDDLATQPITISVQMIDPNTGDVLETYTFKDAELYAVEPSNLSTSEIGSVTKLILFTIANTFVHSLKKQP